MIEAPSVRPWYCLLGVPFLLAGGGLFGYEFVQGIMHLTDSLTQVLAPGKAELSLKGGRTYTVFLEEQSVMTGKVYSTTGSIEGLECFVRAMPGGNSVMIHRASMNTTYTVNGRSGRSIWEFPVQEDGKYEFSCDYSGSPQGPEVVLAIGSGAFEKIFGAVAGGLTALFGGGGGFLAVLVTVLVKRDRERKRLRQLGRIPPPLQDSRRPGN